MPGEIVLRDGAGWYDYEAKYSRAAWSSCAGADLRRRARAGPGARGRGLRARRLRGLARVDFFVDGEDVLLNELNTMPGFTETSVYGKLWAASGVPYPDALDRLGPGRSSATSASALTDSASAGRKSRISEISTWSLSGGSR